MLVTTAVDLILWSLVLVPAIYWVLGGTPPGRKIAASRAGDWLAVVLCGGFGVVAVLIRDLTDGTPPSLFFSTMQYPGPPWSVVFNGIIATSCGYRLLSPTRAPAEPPAAPGPR